MAKQDWEGVGYITSSPFLFCRTSQRLDYARVLSVPRGSGGEGGTAGCPGALFMETVFHEIQGTVVPPNPPPPGNTALLAVALPPPNASASQAVNKQKACDGAPACWGFECMSAA